MKRLVLTAALVAALGAGAAFAMDQAKQPSAPGQQAATAQQTSQQPATAGQAQKPQTPPAATRPRRPKRATSTEAAEAEPAPGGTVIGTVHLPKRVMANGNPLAAGTYRVRVTDQEATPPATGASPQGERWVEFVQGGQVKGKEVASVFSQSDAPQITEDRQSAPPSGRAKVQMLKGGKYLRVWINHKGTNYLIHLPPAA